ncbi:hypothetical protein GUJ93_ZPchr0013g37105 [Zizania palustris]|uniref:Uncharacterized protein n=1 Tax=Zizania palustris TaxID=103762 RepID=A0A8J5X265_ZIZPA|nr:hypothetical protein GUJ93_ZPchr0013g37105 [Zizania palustris]
MSFFSLQLIFYHPLTWTTSYFATLQPKHDNSMATSSILPRHCLLHVVAHSFLTVATITAMHSSFIFLALTAVGHSLPPAPPPASAATHRLLSPHAHHLLPACRRRPLVVNVQTLCEGRPKWVRDIDAIDDGATASPLALVIDATCVEPLASCG